VEVSGAGGGVAAIGLDFSMRLFVFSFAKGWASFPMDFVVVLPMMSVVAACWSGRRLFGRRWRVFLSLLPFTSWRPMIFHRSQCVAMVRLDAGCCSIFNKA
jgi:hypothetical protein